MKPSRQTATILGSALAMGGLFWIADAVYEYFFFVDHFRLMLFDEPLSFSDSLFRNIPPHSLFTRMAFLVACTLGGSLSAWYLRMRREAEDALRESERQKELILNSTSETIAYYDTDLRVVWANRAAGQWMGESPEGLVGRHCYEIWHQLDNPCPDCPVLKAYEAKAPRQAERQTADGRHWLLRSYPVLDREGRVVALVEFGQDITERKQAEEQKRLLKERFHQARKLESVGRLAGGVAHDLNNLLSPILGYSELLLKDTAESDHRRPRLEQILGAGKRARDLVGQLLAFSRKQALRFKPLQVNAMLKDFEELLRRTVRENIDIRMVLAPDLPFIRGDTGQLEQVIMNLAVNAQDAMPDGGRLTIETARVDGEESFPQDSESVASGTHVMLAVGDTGGGMDEETLEHLFEPFFTTKDKGTGLGLATVYGIVKQHGGSIRVRSRPGQGTTFNIYLPARAELAGICEPIDKRSPASCRGGSEAILLAEDDEPVRSLARAILEDLGYTVLVGESPQDALGMLENRQGPVHLLLTDVIMPEMNGKELFDKAAARCPGLKVLYMSGYTDDVIAPHGVLEEGTAFLQKPFSLRSLAEKVREVLEEAT